MADEELSAKMKAIVVEEDKAIDSGGEKVEETIQKADAADAAEDGKSLVADDDEKQKLKKTKKEKKIDSGDSSENDVADYGGKKETKAEDGGESAAEECEKAPNSCGLFKSAAEKEEEAVVRSTATQEGESSSGSQSPRTSDREKLLLVADMADLKTKLADAGSNLVVIDFFAQWCGPCKMISPKVEELAKSYPDVVFLKVDIDECDEIASEYEIQSMPTFFFIKNSTKIDHFSGANFERLKDTMLKHK